MSEHEQDMETAVTPEAIAWRQARHPRRARWKTTPELKRERQAKQERVDGIASGLRSTGHALIWGVTVPLLLLVVIVVLVFVLI